MTEELRKKNTNLRREISHLHGKINQLKNLLKLREDEIVELKRKIKTLEKKEGQENEVIK
jgi:uncharacterized coiled-coil DUF342 family protein